MRKKKREVDPGNTAKKRKRGRGASKKAITCIQRQACGGTRPFGKRVRHHVMEPKKKRKGKSFRKKRKGG